METTSIRHHWAQCAGIACAQSASALVAEKFFDVLFFRNQFSWTPPRRPAATRESTHRPDQVPYTSPSFPAARQGAPRGVLSFVSPSGSKLPRAGTATRGVLSFVFQVVPCCRNRKEPPRIPLGNPHLRGGLSLPTATHQIQHTQCMDYGYMVTLLILLNHGTGPAALYPNV